MKKKTPDIYDNDKDTARVRRHAERFSFGLSFAYLIFMFILSRLMEFPLYASLFYPAVLIVGSILYMNRKLYHKVYEYWFAFSSTVLCALYAIFSGTITVSLVIYMTALIITAMFRDERLIFVDMLMGMMLTAVCFFIKYNELNIAENVEKALEFLIIPVGIYSTHFALTSLVKRDKQLFLFSQQKNRNNLTLLQIVEAKRSEAEAAAKVKTEFLANTSHEIRTPMNSIMGMTELALREDVSPQLRNYLGNIRDAGTNLLNIINDILDFSKIESGKTELSISDYNILSVMNDVCNIISIRMNSEAVQLITCIDPGVPSVLTGDERRIKQIILNLASNAVKYTRHGSITISISSKSIDDGNIMLCCDVKDTGIGIKENDIKRLFNAFERADTKRNRNIEGTGLGLAICKSLTEMMGGTIKVRSVYGAGSVFGFEIPQGVKDKSSCIRIKDGENRRILLCMKDREQLAAVSEELNSLGISFTAVQDIRTLPHKEIIGYSDILIDYEEYQERKISLSAIETPIAVIANPGVRLPASDSAVKKLYRPVTIISLLSLFGTTDIFADNSKNVQIKQFCMPDASILVVDDNSTNLLVAKKLISLYRADIDTAESGIQALKMIQKKDYDIVFMDHMMPELDGIETAQAIRSLGGKYSRLTIIALTANVVSGAAELFRESGIDDFLGKPIEMSELNRILSRYIPEEKQISSESEAKAPEKIENSGFLDRLNTIDGLDVKAALKQCNGDSALLSDILRSAAASPTIAKLSEAFEKKDLRSYTIYVHGIKGALRNVGMEALGALAYDLETAGKRGDLEYIEARHSEFMNSFNEFSAATLRIVDSKQEKPVVNGDLTRLKEYIKDIIGAAEDMDYSRAKKITDIIEKETYGEKYDRKIHSLCSAVDSFEFSEAEDIARSIREEI